MLSRDISDAVSACALKEAKGAAGRSGGAPLPIPGGFANPTGGHFIHLVKPWILWELPVLKVMATNKQEQEQVDKLWEKTTGGPVQITLVDQGYTSVNAAKQTSEHGIALQAVKHTEDKKRFVLRPRRWGVPCAFGL